MSKTRLPWNKASLERALLSDLKSAVKAYPVFRRIVRAVSDVAMMEALHRGRRSCLGVMEV
jgi:hypothetical protein